VMVLLSKFILFSALVVSLLIAYPLSRAIAISLMQDMFYISNKVQGNASKSETKSKPLSPKVWTSLS
jgi:adenosylcobinamide-GDP ribazoletransferase